MTGLIDYLQHNHEKLSSKPRNHIKKLGIVVQPYDSSTGEEDVSEPNITQYFLSNNSQMLHYCFKTH